MKTFLDYVKKFDQKAKEVFARHIPKGTKTGNKLKDIEAFFVDIPKQLKSISTELNRESDKISMEASKDGIDTKKLAKEFHSIFEKHKNEWTRKNKPK